MNTTVEQNPKEWKQGPTTKWCDANSHSTDAWKHTMLNVESLPVWAVLQVFINRA